MSMKTTMETKLKNAFQPQRLEVVDESHLHAGHHHEPWQHEQREGDRQVDDRGMERQ